MSQTDFSLSGSVIHFAADAQGDISHLVVTTVESNETAVRKK
jgi:hypothetical protein